MQRQLAAFYAQQFGEKQVGIQCKILDASLLQSTAGFLDEIFQPGHSAGFLFSQLSEIVSFDKAVDHIIEVAFNDLSQTVEGQTNTMVG